MKRIRPRLSFDDDSLSDAQDGAAEGPPRKWRGLSELSASRRSAEEQVGVSGGGLLVAGVRRSKEEEEMQVAAVKRALGLLSSGRQRLGAEPAAARTESTVPDTHGSDAPDRDGGEGQASPAVLKPPTSISEVRTFSEFLRFGPTLKAEAAQMSVEELTATCETAARLKFFDGELFDRVFMHIREKMSSGHFSVEQITTVAASLVDLNAYKSDIFSAAARILLPLVGQLSKAMRLHWLKLLAAAKHTNDESFEIALRTTPLPGGVDVTTSADFFLCWDFVRNGACPRGASCKWLHPKKITVDTK